MSGEAAAGRRAPASGDDPMRQLARSIFDAERRRMTRPPVTATDPQFDLAGAYAVQRRYAALKLASGASLVGLKVGITSAAAQRAFGTDAPVYGRVFDDMVIGAGGMVDSTWLIQPRVEPELAFELGTELRGPGVTADDVRAATRGVRPCLEIVDSRITDWRVTLADLVADNAAGGRYVAGAPLVTVDGLDLAAASVAFGRNGALTEHGTGAAALGDPVRSVAWLANALADDGQALPAGAFVLSGSLTAALPAAPGDRFEAVFAGIGRVRCQFTGGTDG